MSMDAPARHIASRRRQVTIKQPLRTDSSFFSEFLLVVQLRIMPGKETLIHCRNNQRKQPLQSSFGRCVLARLLYVSVARNNFVFF